MEDEPGTEQVGDYCHSRAGDTDLNHGGEGGQTKREKEHRLRLAASRERVAWAPREAYTAGEMDSEHEEPRPGAREEKLVLDFGRTLNPDQCRFGPLRGTDPALAAEGRFRKTGRASCPETQLWVPQALCFGVSQT